MKALSLPILFVGVAALSSSAFAIDLKFTGLERSDALQAKISVNGSSYNTVFAGKLSFTDGSTAFGTYCADALSTLNGTTHGYSSSVVNLAGTSGLSLAGRIVANNFATATTAEQQAGLQLAVWSALYNGGNSFNASGSNFKVKDISASALGFASTYYSTINTPSTNVVTYFGSSAHGAQSQLTAVPEPITMATLGVGLLGLARRRRKTA